MNTALQGATPLRPTHPALQPTFTHPTPLQGVLGFKIYPFSTSGARSLGGVMHAWGKSGSWGVDSWVSPQICMFRIFTRGYGEGRSNVHLVHDSYATFTPQPPPPRPSILFRVVGFLDLSCRFFYAPFHVFPQSEADTFSA